MSTEAPESTMGTKPVEQHKWLEKLVGEWTTESEMSMGPGEPLMKSQGKESVSMLGGLWAHIQGSATMPDGCEMTYITALGYDVSFNEYRGAWFSDMSSHLWKYVGTLSEDGRVMTLNCVGPNMVKDGETANYRDVIEIIDDNNRVMTSYGEDENGEWQQFMKCTYTRK